MSLRDQLLDASKRAAEVLDGAQAKRRVQEDGYTRVDPVAIAEAGGVPVMMRPLEKLLGAFLQPNGMPGILVNSRRPVGLLHLTCAHELGHYFLGHDTTADEHLEYGEKAAPHEQAANEFAFKLLMPRWLLLHVMQRKGWGRSHLQHAENVYQLSLRLGVSYQAMVWQLKQFNWLAPGAATIMNRVQPKAVKEATLAGAVEMPRDGGDVWLLDPSDRDVVIEPRATDRFLLRLPSHAGAGYIWTMDDAADAGFTIRPVLRDVSHEAKPAGPVVAGAQRDMQYVLEPTEASTESTHTLPVALAERRPWEPPGAELEHLSLRAKYEALPDGLSLGTRQRHLQEALQG